jgi:methionyl-tRNA formyltransferase
MKEKIKVVYAGYHIETLNLLLKDTEFDVVGTGLIEEFISDRTLNPINLLFKLIYDLRRRNQCRMLERILLRVWFVVGRLATSFYCSYSDYLKTLSEHKMKIVDFSNTSKTMDFLKSNSVDLMVVCTWSILTEKILTLPKYGTINIHPSKLPQYRGALPTLWSLKNGDTESAVTYLVMEKSMDAGAIIGQHTFSIHEGADWYSLEEKINEILQATFLSNLKGFITGEIRPVAQDLRNSSTTGKYDDYMKIDWATEDGTAIFNKINSYPVLVPTDYCYTALKGKKIIIKKATFIKDHVILPKLGQYQVQGFTLLVQAKNGMIATKMFSGLQVKDSILFILKRKAEFN